MIKIENVDTYGWKHAIRGMRNPMNSWNKSDSGNAQCADGDCQDCSLSNGEHGCKWSFNDSLPFAIGYRDMTLMKSLVSAGTDHRKFLRMIVVYLDITAPLYWWKEFDTYKVGTVANSCSTMHKIHAKEFTLEDFSYEKLSPDGLRTLKSVIDDLNFSRIAFVESKDKFYFDEMIQLLPSSYNQKRTVLLNYEVLRNMYRARKSHKLAEWREFCGLIETLPYAELITMKGEQT